VDPTIAPKDKSIARVFVGAEYAKEKLWEGYKDKVYKKVMKRLTTILPDVHKQIEVKVIGTPFTFSRFTGNRDGALFGWSAIPAQIDRQVFPTRTSIGNLYLAGHWVTHGIGQSGVAVVAFSGKYTAKAILNKLKER
jgi:prolycopene isomerase